MDIEDLGDLFHSKEYHRFTEDDVTDFQKRLLKWYGRNRRKLPWRGDPPPYGNAEKRQRIGRNKDITSFFVSQGPKKKKKTENFPPEGHKFSSYGVWVSEVMLQQTRVETVIGYFGRWMEAFPTIEDLAQAEIEDVNKIWAGLGYYRRAKLLREGARKVVSDYKGELPKTVKQLLDIPGIGPYTAGAIASIGHGVQAPIVDGNVIRVLSRVRALACTPRDSRALKLHWHLAEVLVSPDDPGSFNQSMMELGATLCTQSQPNCNRCPVKLHCNAFKELENKKRPHSEFFETDEKTEKCDLCGSEDDLHYKKFNGSVLRYPLKAVKKAPREEGVAICVVSRLSESQSESNKIDDNSQDHKVVIEFLILKRPEKGLLAGQWEFPSVVLGTTKTGKSLTYTKRKKLMNKYLREAVSLDLDLPNARKSIQSRKELGEILHVFSHIKQTMICERVMLANFPHDLESDSYKWVKSSTLRDGSIGITAGVKKVCQLALKVHVNSELKFSSRENVTAGRQVKRRKIK